MDKVREREISILRRQTRMYIELAPTTTRLVPHPEVRTAAGGLVRNAPGVPRAPQTFRLVALDRMASGTKNLVAGRPADGVERQANFEILGEWDLEIARGDTFVEMGTEYEVIEVQPLASAPYLRRAYVRGNPG